MSAMSRNKVKSASRSKKNISKTGFSNYFNSRPAPEMTHKKNVWSQNNLYLTHEMGA